MTTNKFEMKLSATVTKLKEITIRRKYLIAGIISKSNGISSEKSWEK